MNHGPFRFIHAGDFHLERPPCGLADVPEHLRDVLCDAPFDAARRVFDLAIAEKVDFVVLTGDLVEPRLGGPRAAAFLVEQFERMAAANIAVYWAASRLDAAIRWPKPLPLPESVHVFPSGGVTEWIHERGGVPLVCIRGISRPQKGRVPVAAFRSESRGLPTIAAAHGRVHREQLAKQEVDYLALGGLHARRTISGSPRTAHYAGTPQGRSPEEPGAHGCTLVEVDETRRFRTRFVPTDGVRWQHEQIEVQPHFSRDHLRAAIAERSAAIAATAGPITTLVTWNLAGEGPLVKEFRVGEASSLPNPYNDFLGGLEGRPTLPSVWTVSIEAEPAAALAPEWYEEETLLGDFLRLVKEYEEDGRRTLDLSDLVAPACRAGAWGAEELNLPESLLLRGDRTLAPGSARQVEPTLLREAGELGADLLRGQPWNQLAFVEAQS